MEKEPEPLFLLFAAICVGIFGYAVLRPMYQCSCFKAKPPPAPPNPGIKEVKIHPARAIFRLWSPGKARYLSMPVRPVSASVRKKKKKSKKSKVLQSKFQACVNAIIEQNIAQPAALTFDPKVESAVEVGARVAAVVPLPLSVLPEGGRRPPSAKEEEEMNSTGVLQLKRALFRARGRLKLNNTTAPMPQDGATVSTDIFAISRARLREAVFSGGAARSSVNKPNGPTTSAAASAAIVMNVMELESMASIDDNNSIDDAKVEHFDKSHNGPLALGEVGGGGTWSSIRGFNSNRLSNRVSDLSNFSTSPAKPVISGEVAPRPGPRDLDFEKGNRKNNHKAINIPPCAPEYAW